MQISVLPAAQADLLEQYAYLLEHASEELADRFLLAAEAAMRAAAEAPQIGTPVHLEDSALRGLRSWPLGGFPSVRLYYLPPDTTLCVIRILHGKRDLERLLV